MSDFGGLPAYPPQRNAWEFPAPPVSRGWKWAAIAVIVASVMAIIAMSVSIAVIDGKDVPSMIEDEQLVAVITRQCDIMTQTVDSMPVSGTPDEQLAILSDQNRAVSKMLAAIRTVDGAARRSDKPTDAWLRDWELLVKARELYAAALLSGHAQLRVPRGPNGKKITVRMNEVWLDDPAACTVPASLLDPYPTDAASV